MYKNIDREIERKQVLAADSPSTFSVIGINGLRESAQVVKRRLKSVHILFQGSDNPSMLQ